MYGSCQRSAGITPRYAAAAALTIARIAGRSSSRHAGTPRGGGVAERGAGGALVGAARGGGAKGAILAARRAIARVRAVVDTARRRDARHDDHVRHGGGARAPRARARRRRPAVPPAR